jgi:hypothetical protein
MSRLRVLLLSLPMLLAGCGGGDAGAEPLATEWPILLSHPWSNTADSSFHGDELVGRDSFDPYGVKRALEAGGAVVYQPSKLAYASHEVRGRLLYRKCAGGTVAQALCDSGEAELIDGVEWATLDYCALPERRARHGFSSEPECQRGLRFNIICHSQGCPDSRYMMVAVTNRFSGEPMYRHVASWTSLAGANKGTALADWILGLTAACLLPGCRSPLLDVALLADSLRQDGTLVPNATESIVALSRKYMLDTTDMNCDPTRRDDCAPSFNELYPLPEDPTHPILYQSFSFRIDDIEHPCYRGLRLYYDVVAREEGANDAYISVESQQFATYGRDGSGGRTPVIVREINGVSLDPAQAHPGLDHMAPSNSMAVGIEGVQCANEDNSAFRFSRVGLYRDVVAELVRWGY